MIDFMTKVPDRWSSSFQEVDLQFHNVEYNSQLGQCVYNTTSNNQKIQYSCPRCNKVYNWKTNLQRHIRLECGKAPQWHCTMCPYKTKQKGHLLRHVAGRHRIYSHTL
ncbi:hypothetical protein C0J52_13327 [Blattella germanica]|nr:hypothetical protein C0J52_13327 [Blattella germanica]